MSSNWSSSENCFEASAQECYYGMKTYLRASWTRKNPERWFFECAQYGKGPHCKYFEWFNPRICECGGEVVYELRVRIKTMEEELRKQAKKEKRSNVILFMSWRIIFALYFAFMCYV
jgi:hypothetical protein